MGYEGFNESFVTEHFDEDSYKVYLREFFESDVYDSPESYLDDSDRELSRGQVARITELKEIIQGLEFERDSLDDEDEEYGSEYERLNDEITILQEEIQEIEDDPDGDYDSDKLDDVVESKVSDYKYDAKDFHSTFFGDDFKQWIVDNGFINEDDFAQAVVDSDGYGATLNNYDGSEDSISFEGETYYIFYDGDFH